MINPSNQFLTLSFLRSKSFKGLVRNMNINNLKFKSNFKYSSPVQDKTGTWYTTFYFHLENYEQLQDELDK